MMSAMSDAVRGTLLSVLDDGCQNIIKVSLENRNTVNDFFKIWLGRLVN